MRDGWMFWLLCTTLVLSVAFLIGCSEDSDYHKVSGSAMESTFSDGDLVRVEAVCVLDIKRGDVVIFKAPDQPERERMK